MRAPQGIQAVPDVTRPELKVRRRPIIFPTLHVRKTKMCHRGAWKAGWQFPDVTRPELKVRGRPIFFPTLHVRKTGSSETGKWSDETGKWSDETGSGAAKQGREGLQRCRNSVVPNRFGIDVPWRAV